MFRGAVDCVNLCWHPNLEPICGPYKLIFVTMLPLMHGLHSSGCAQGGSCPNSNHQFQLQQLHTLPGGQKTLLPPPAQSQIRSQPVLFATMLCSRYHEAIGDSTPGSQPALEQCMMDVAGFGCKATESVKKH